MPRDYAKNNRNTKRRSNTRQKRRAASKSNRRGKKTKSTISPRLWLIALLLVGGFVAGLFYLQHQPSTSQAQRNTVLTVHAHHHATTKMPAKVNASNAAPKFDFYTMLPNNKNQLPAVKAPPVTQHYLLQAASVKKYNDADRLKAQLILLGFDAFVRKTQHNGHIWYRIYLGPYISLNAAKQSQHRLLNNNIKSLLIKASRLQNG